MLTASLWEHTLTFFPQYQRALAETCPVGATVAVIGASDGKFVLPLARDGYQVSAIENDFAALYGGDVLLPISGMAYAPGLIKRLKEADLDDSVRVMGGDFLDTDPSDMSCDAVWTSCSWHYSANHRHPLSEFVGRMQQLVRPGGLFGAEFMMPIERRQDLIEHYTTPEKLARYFSEGWTVRLTLRTDKFTEAAHVGQLKDHPHQMGLIIAARHPQGRTKGQQCQR